MTHPRAILRAGALCIGLAAQPAAADLTPAGLWQAWQDRAAAAGHPLSAEVDRGGTFGLAGLVFTRPLGTGTIALGLDRVDLVQDGADVRATLPAGGTVTLTATPGPDAPGGETVKAVLALGETPLVATASGEVASPVWTLAAPTAALRLVSLTRDGVPVPAAARIDLAGLSGRLAGTQADAPLAVDLRADRIASEIETTDPATGDRVRSTATQADTDLRARLTAAPSDPAAWSLRATLTGGASDAVTLRDGPAGSLEAESRQNATTLDIAMSATRTDYDARITGFATTLTGSLLPAGPVGVAVDDVALVLSLPAGPAAGTQTARLALELGGVRPDDRLWAQLDPAGALPRDPARATLRAEADLDGAEPGATGPGDAALPGLLPRALRLPEIALQLGPASLRGDGAFDIPAGPMGVPDATRTEGRLDLRAAGLNGLLQQAMAAGALTTEQMMGAQMMLGMFAVQGEGDSFTSRIELLPGGGLMVNGARLR